MAGTQAEACFGRVTNRLYPHIGLITVICSNV
jgi:hypothetical protein